MTVPSMCINKAASLEGVPEQVAIACNLIKEPMQLLVMAKSEHYANGSIPPSIRRFCPLMYDA